MVNKKNKFVIYSASIGGYDKIKKIPKSDCVDCIMFTDISVEKLPKNNGWEYRSVDLTLGRDNGFVNRWYKMHPHLLFPEYAASLYIDATFTIVSYEQIVSRFKELEVLKFNIALPLHPERNCIYDECEMVVTCKKELKKNVKKVVGILKEQNYPKNNGLYGNSIIYRKHNSPEIIKLMEQWWAFINTYSRRDQLSLCYLLWKNNVSSTTLFNYEVKNEVFTYSSHIGPPRPLGNTRLEIFIFISKQKGLKILSCFIRDKSRRVAFRNKYL